MLLLSRIYTEVQLGLSLTNPYGGGPIAIA
jgi:hypothetical protein